MTVRYAAFITSALPLAIAAGQSALATGVTSDGSCTRSRSGSQTSALRRPALLPRSKRSTRPTSRISGSLKLFGDAVACPAAKHVVSGVA